MSDDARLNRNQTVSRRWYEGELVAVGGSGGLLLHSAATDYCPAVWRELRDDTLLITSDSWDHVLELACDFESAVRLQSVGRRCRAVRTCVVVAYGGLPAGAGFPQSIQPDDGVGFPPEVP